MARSSCCVTWERRKLRRDKEALKTGAGDHETTDQLQRADMASGLHLLLLLLVGCVSSSEAQLRLFNIHASDLPSDIMGVTDGYVKVFLSSASLGKTSIRHNDANPWWEEEFHHLAAQPGDVLRLEVHDSDLLFDDLLGVCQRQLQAGTHGHDCFLEDKGALHYRYTLGSQ